MATLRHSLWQQAAIEGEKQLVQLEETRTCEELPGFWAPEAAELESDPTWFGFGSHQVPFIRPQMSGAAAWVSEKEILLYRSISCTLPLAFQRGQILNICHCPFNPGDIHDTFYDSKALASGPNNPYQTERLRWMCGLAPTQAWIIWKEATSMETTPPSDW